MADALTVGTFAIPQMVKHGYAPRLAWNIRCSDMAGASVVRAILSRFSALPEMVIINSMAGRRFHEERAFLDLLRALRRFDHGKGDAVLDGAARVLVLELEEQAATTGIEALGLDHGCVADEL